MDWIVDEQLALAKAIHHEDDNRELLFLDRIKLYTHSNKIISITYFR
jgi:hypothetical protein